MVLNTCLPLLLAASVIFGPPESAADKLIRASHEALANQPSFEIRQTTMQKAQALVDGKPTGQAMDQKQEAVIEIDFTHGLTKMTTKAGPQELAVLRKGNRVALKQGEGQWAAPSGPFAKIGDQLANPFACPLPKPGPNQPKWEVAGTEKLNGETVTVVRTVGQSAVGYAEARMREGMASAFSGSSTAPTLKVHSYVSTQYIRKSDGRRLKSVQISLHDMTITGPDGSKVSMRIESVNTSEYGRFGKVKIDIPADALSVLESQSKP